MTGARIKVSGRARPQFHGVGFALSLWISAVDVIGSIAADDPPERQVEVNPASTVELTTTVVQIIANDSVSENIARLIAIDSSLDARRSAAARELEGRIIVALARSGDQRGVAYVRSVFEDDADRRIAFLVAGESKTLPSAPQVPQPENAPK